jgi:hypothetical protein
MNKCFYVLLFCIISQVLFSQNKTKIDSLKKLGRDSLINLAVKKLNESAFKPNNYDRIIVKANENSLVVEFSLSIVLSDSKSCFYDFVFVALVGSGSGKSIKGDCENPKFYTFPKTDKKKINFVFDAINKSNEIGHIPNNKLDEDTKMEIVEKLNYYYVEVSNWSTFSHYKVNKLTGKIYEANHKHYDRSNEERDDFEIVK